MRIFKNIHTIVAIATLTLSVTGCSQQNSTDTLTESSAEIAESETELSEEDKAILTHTIFVHFDEEKEVLDDSGNEFDYAYDWNLEFENEDVEGAFYDYLYYKSGYYPIYANIVGNGLVLDRYAVWEGTGYTIGTIISEDGQSAKLYIKFSDNELKDKVETLVSEKDKQSKSIADKRKEKYEKFNSNLDENMPEIIKKYPLYAGAYVNCGSIVDGTDDIKNNQEEITLEDLDKLMELVTLSKITEVDEDEINNINEEDTKGIITYELINDCNNEELINFPTVVYGIYFTDDTKQVYVLDEQVDKIYKVENEELDNYIDTVYKDVLSRGDVKQTVEDNELDNTETVGE